VQSMVTMATQTLAEPSSLPGQILSLLVWKGKWKGEGGAHLRPKPKWPIGSGSPRPPLEVLM
jgi:hypothetical protein